MSPRTLRTVQDTARLLRQFLVELHTNQTVPGAFMRQDTAELVVIGIADVMLSMCVDDSEREEGQG
jgi:hypothetical protein